MAKFFIGRTQKDYSHAFMTYKISLFDMILSILDYQNKLTVFQSQWKYDKLLFMGYRAASLSFYLFPWGIEVLLLFVAQNHLMS